MYSVSNEQADACPLLNDDCLGVMSFCCQWCYNQMEKFNKYKK